MKKYDLSILIPARNEQFIAKTVEDILQHKRGKTEVIVGLDGQWAEPGLTDHPDVRIVYVAPAIGQRALTNRLAQLSTAKYVAKCDAHVSFAPGFDVQLMASLKGHDNWTIVPIMKNLHAFDWVCPDGHRRYQGPSGPCDTCGKAVEKDVVWVAKDSPKSTSYCFDTTLHFQYFKEFAKRPEGQGDLTPTMSLQGSFFMMTRVQYWELNICDEAHGSWGQQGVEVACKTWLSGGQVMVDHKTWYAHMFRTQGGDFSFPYPQSGKEVDKARTYSRDIWFNNKFAKQVYPLSWLIEKFAPVQDWHQPKGADVLAQVVQAGQRFNQEPTKGIIYYTDNQLNIKLARQVQDQLRKISVKKSIPITSASLKPMENMGANIRLKLKRGHLTMFKQILAALEASTADIIYFCEHDVLYHPSHFDFTPPTKDKFYYNHNVWRVRLHDKFAVHWDANQVAELVCDRQHALKFYRERIAFIEKHGFNRSYEPGGRNATEYEAFRSAEPNIDIRHGGNLTKSKWSPRDFRDKSTMVNWQEGAVPEWASAML